MAENINITNLDFDDIKSSIKSFLNRTTEFKDFDFEGSNLANLIDILAYNTYYNSYYVNMVANEMFLDTALLRESVLSRAKELNYLPRSATAGKAVVTLNITVSGAQPSAVTIPKGTVFSTESNGRTFTFATIAAFTALPKGTGYEATNVELYEGELLSFTYEAHNEKTPPKYVIPNENVDVSNIGVKVQNSATDNTVTSYNRAENILGLTKTDPVYFLEGYTGNQYRIVFGDGIFGKKLSTGNIVTVEYCATNGSDANGADVFTYTSGIENATAVTITTTAAVSGGAYEESVESIKFNAPRSYATQDRAVTSNDYKLLVQQQFPTFKAIRAYGGEDANPPQFGKVFLAIRPSIGETLTDVTKNDVLTYLKDKSVIGISTEIIDPNYIYLKFLYTFNFDPDKTVETVSSLEKKIRDEIVRFGDVNLGKFNSTLRASKLAADLDKLDDGILGSGGSITLTKRLKPTIGERNSFVIEFNNILRTEPEVGTTISSTFFTSNGKRVRLADNGQGIINEVGTGTSGVEEVITSGVGTVDYGTGRITINKLQFDNFDGTNFVVSAAPLLFDIVPAENQILLIDVADVQVLGTAETDLANV